MSPEEYRTAAGQLARKAAMPAATAANMEARLHDAFSHRVQGVHSASPPRRWGWTAAAIVTIVSGAGLWYGRPGPITVKDVMDPANSETVRRPSIPLGSGTGADRVRLNADPTETVRLKADATETVHLKADPTETVRLKADATETSPRRARVRPLVRPAGFVTVPAAVGLPPFESGVIVRMSLPVAALPSYGVDISPASGDEPVEADVLVGQDGRARAIRLVANNSRSDK